MWHLVHNIVNKLRAIFTTTQPGNLQIDKLNSNIYWFIWTNKQRKNSIAAVNKTDVVFPCEQNDVFSLLCWFWSGITKKIV